MVKSLRFLWQKNCYYKLILNIITDLCEPVCNEVCFYSNCTAPDVCSCIDGYKTSENVSNICEPVCDEIKCLENSFCEAPNICECEGGYENELNETEGIHACYPICQVECENGQCIRPQECQCNPGYEFKEGSNHICIAVCDPECLNGNCSAPNQCDCFEGYMLNETGHCFKFCSPDCLGGECIEGDCICGAGFYIFNATENICEPDCREINCLDGKCEGNNTCSCEDGFDFTLDVGCQAHCSNSCINGSCSAPEFCECFVGYQFSFESDFECEPICGNFSAVDENFGENTTVGCLNGECTAPQVCTCFAGFVLNDTFALQCIEQQVTEDENLPRARASGMLSDTTAKM